MSSNRGVVYLGQGKVEVQVWLWVLWESFLPTQCSRV